MNKIVNVYYANHGKLGGIEDFLTILKDIFIKRGCKINISDTLDKNAINLVIDEFTNIICNAEIIKFKTNYPDTKLYYILTEFIETKLLVKSFNFFGGLMDAAPLAAANIYLRTCRKDFNSPSLTDWFMAILYLPMLVFVYLIHQIKNIWSKNKVSVIQKLHHLIYMKMRYLGLEKMIPYADGVILSHPMIGSEIKKIFPDTNIIGTIYPETDYSNFNSIKKSLFKNKYLGFEITGSITPFRKWYVKKIDQDIIISGLKNIFQPCKAISFSGVPSEVRATYSLHPPQTRFWKYASPTRIYRALFYDHNVPVLPKVFHQHPIEKLCIVYKDKRTLIDLYHFYKNPDFFFDTFKPRLIEYMKIANKKNKHLVDKIINLNKT